MKILMQSSKFRNDKKKGVRNADTYEGKLRVHQKFTASPHAPAAASITASDNVG